MSEGLGVAVGILAAHCALNTLYWHKQLELQGKEFGLGDSEFVRCFLAALARTIVARPRNEHVVLFCKYGAVDDFKAPEGSDADDARKLDS